MEFGFAARFQDHFVLKKLKLGLGLNKFDEGRGEIFIDFLGGGQIDEADGAGRRPGRSRRVTRGITSVSGRVRPHASRP